MRLLVIFFATILIGIFSLAPNTSAQITDNKFSCDTDTISCYTNTNSDSYGCQASFHAPSDFCQNLDTCDTSTRFPCAANETPDECENPGYISDGAGGCTSVCENPTWPEEGPPYTEETKEAALQECQEDQSGLPGDPLGDSPEDEDQEFAKCDGNKDGVVNKDDSGYIDSAFGCSPFLSTDEMTEFWLIRAVGLAGGIALFLIIIASYQLMTSSGDPGRVANSRELITAAVTGLLLLIFIPFIIWFAGVEVIPILPRIN